MGAVWFLRRSFRQRGVALRVEGSKNKGATQIAAKISFKLHLVGEPRSVVIAATLLNLSQVGHDQGRLADQLGSRNGECHQASPSRDSFNSRFRSFPMIRSGTVSMELRILTIINSSGCLKTA